MNPQNSSVAALTIGVAVAGASLITVASVSPSVPNVQIRAVQLAGVDTADSPLGDGTALVFGPSGVPIPPPQYVDAADTLYLQALGFTGTAQSAFEPNGAYPLSGVKSLGFGTSLGQDQQIMVSDVGGQIAAGGVSPANPVVIFGYSQSSVASSLIMSQLAQQGVPSDDVHLVLVGDLNNPNGGFDNTFDFPAGNTAALTAFDASFSPRHHPTSIRPTSTRSNTTVSPTSRTTRRTCWPTSTPTWGSFWRTSYISISPPGRSAARLCSRDRSRSPGRG